MTYTKPHNLKYTDLAIYVDNNIYADNCDYETCFKYIYLLFYMLSYKQALFTTEKNYDEFSLYAAGRLLNRYRDKKQFQDNPELPKIKSVLNYIKRVVYPLSVTYKQNQYAEIFDPEILGEDVVAKLQCDLRSKAVNNNKKFLETEFNYYFKKLNKTIKHTLLTIPYASDKLIFHRIYMSCYLSLLKQMTISNKNKVRLTRRESKGLNLENLIDGIYAEERNDEVVLFHLEDNMQNYIDTLVRKIKHNICKDLRYLIGSNTPSDALINGILTSPMEGNNTDND